MGKMRAQATLEYMVLIAIFLLLLSGIYALSIDMAARKGLLQSQMESERVAYLVGRAADSTARGGNGFYSDIFVGSSPEQTVYFLGQDILALGPQNKTMALYRASINFSASSLSNFSANQWVRLNRTGGVIYVQPKG